MHSFQIHIFQGLIEPQKSTFWAMTLLKISPNVRSDYTANLFATFCDSEPLRFHNESFQLGSCGLESFV